MDRQGVRRDDVALLREGTQIDRSSFAPDQVEHSTASLADEMIVLGGLRIESGSLCVQKEGADLTLVDETVKVPINRGETDPRQFFVNPPVDLMGERMSVIALESFEHQLQLACRTFAGGSPHRLTSNPGYQADRIEPLVRGVIKSTISCQAIPGRPSELRWRRRRGTRAAGRQGATHPLSVRRSSPSTRPRHREACSASGTSSARRTNDGAGKRHSVRGLDLNQRPLGYSRTRSNFASVPFSEGALECSGVILNWAQI